MHSLECYRYVWPHDVSVWNSLKICNPYCSPSPVSLDVKFKYGYAFSPTTKNKMAEYCKVPKQLVVMYFKILIFVHQWIHPEATYVRGTQNWKFTLSEIDDHFDMIQIERLVLQDTTVQRNFVQCTKGSIDIQFYRWMGLMKMLEFHLGVLPVALSESLAWIISLTLGITTFDVHLMYPFLMVKCHCSGNHESPFLLGYCSATFEVL